jgi:uncharacterized protein
MTGLETRRTERLKPTREFRRFCVDAVGVRAKGSGSTEIDIEGYASITDAPYTVTDWLGEYTETISSGAFKKTLEENDDVRLLFNHDGIPLARTKSETLTLTEDKKGLRTEATLDTRSGTANDLVIAMQRGDLDEMSFAFKVERQEWNEDYTERWINEVKLFDVSVVTYPANPATSVGLRALDVLKHLDDRTARAILQRYGVPAPKPVSAPGMRALRLAQIAKVDQR